MLSKISISVFFFLVLQEQQMRAATAVDSSTLKRKVQIDATAFEGQ